QPGDELAPSGSPPYRITGRWLLEWTLSEGPEPLSDRLRRGSLGARCWNGRRQRDQNGAVIHSWRRTPLGVAGWTGCGVGVSLEDAAGGRRTCTGRRGTSTWRTPPARRARRDCAGTAAAAAALHRCPAA